MRQTLLALSILLALAGSVRADITSNLEAWWKLDDNSTTTAVDSSGNGHTQTLLNTPTPGTAKIGLYSLGFASASSESGSATTWGGAQGSGGKTFAAWVKATGTYASIASWGTSAAGQSFRVQIETSGELWLRASSNTAKWGSGLADGAWHHVVIVKPASANVTGLSCYIDGVLTAATATTGTDTINIGSANPVYLAYDWGGTAGYLNGSLDDVRIYSRELSSGDVTELYNWRGISYSRSRVVNGGGTVQKQSQSALANQ